MKFVPRFAQHWSAWEQKAALVILNQLCFSRRFEIIGVGDVVQFDGRRKGYEMGNKGGCNDVWKSPMETDYKLHPPTRLVKLHLRSGCAV